MRSLLCSLCAVLVFTACPDNKPPGMVGKDAGPSGKPDTGDEVITGPDASTTDCVDEDQDGYGQGCAKGNDCDDTRPTAFPGATEVCTNTVDDDCDGETDEEPCGCPYGVNQECFTGPAAKAGVGLCRKGLMRCNNDQWTSCQGQVLPTTEACDGLDNDCDGRIDDGVRNACGACGDLPAEACGDGLDNDCNGQTDESCGTCDPTCLCAAGVCTCHPPTNQPCYSGPPGTAGVGTCKGGLHDCQLQGADYVWGACVGEVVPKTEVCGNKKDDDCDGVVDDGCAPTCVPEVEVCDGKDNDCDGLVDEGVANACGTCGAVTAEVCDDQLDNDCDGQVDEGCPCTGSSQPCYRGPAGTLGKGVCKVGTQECSGGEIPEWGECTGDVVPGVELCGNGKDDDCDGVTDDGCACREGESRACGTAVGECKKGTQKCRANKWGDCEGAEEGGAEACDGKDNDCDGLIDEGVLNACGTCPPAPCYEEGWTDPGNCTAPGRTCDNVVPDPTKPGQVTLDQTTNTLLPYIYIAVTNRNEVALLNTDTGQKVWQKPTYGMSPSRTAVALDGTVWVGNRCLFDGEDNNFECSSMAHLDLAGNLICRADIPGWVRGVAIDADGNAWAGTWNGQAVWKVSGKNVDNTQSPPRCQIITSVPLGVPVYGLAVDGRGYLWTASNPAKKVDVATGAVLASVNHGGFYGIAIDQANRVWFGGWSGCATGNCTDMHRIEPEPPHTVLGTGVMGVTAVTVHPDGSVWGSKYDGANKGAVKVTLDAAGTAVANIEHFPDPQGYANHGIAVDRTGKLWSPQVWAVGYVNRWTAAGAHDGRFEVHGAQELYTYSDMTGIQLRTITTREGHWYQLFDSGYAAATWDHAEWTADVPAGTSVSVQFRAANSQADFAAGNATAWCGPFTASPASFNPGCGFLNGHRWIQADVKLNTTADDVRPSFSGLKVFWAH